MKYTRLLTIAGSDSGGGAGVQADLKTFSALGCYGMTVITALTAQNTLKVTDVLGVPPDFVEAQLNAVLDDMGVDAVKIGMLQCEETARVVGRGLRRFKVSRMVLDPVMVAKSGDKLLEPEAIKAIIEDLLPLTTVVTPNLPEAKVLTGQELESPEEIEYAAKYLCELGAGSAVIKGGHMKGSLSSDYLYIKEANQGEWLEARRVYSPNTHGTGCTFSAAIACGLAKGQGVSQAVREAKEYIHGAISAAQEFQLGAGHGPVHHFHHWWPKD